MTTLREPFATRGFCHEAFFYSGSSELVPAVEGFVREGVSVGDKVLVVLSRAKTDLLRTVLGDEADRVAFADMDVVGANPARIIPLWRSFIDVLTPGEGARGVGEPVTASRPPAELAECQVHEVLLNIAFAQTTGFWLLCPYDTTELADEVLEEARHSHAYVGSRNHGPSANRHYLAGVSSRSRINQRLADPPVRAEHITADLKSIGAVRKVIRERAIAFGLGAFAVEDFVAATHEVVVNSVAHGCGRGEVSIWAEDDRLICEVRGEGRLDDPLVGRRQPAVDSEHGRGLWMANQLCDLVQIRSVPDGTVVRLHMRRQP